MASLISQVQDILADQFSDGFIAIGVYYFGGKVEPFINAALEGKLPEVLQKYPPKLRLNDVIESSMDSSSTSYSKITKPSVSFLESRQSIFNDEFSLT